MKKRLSSLPALLAIWLLAFSPAAKSEETYDAIIVGAGIAGLSAALDLARGGANVAVFDMNSQGSGHAILATGIAMVDTPRQHQAGYQDSPDQALRDWLAYSGDGNRDWLAFYAEHSREMIYDWLTELGVTFDNLSADDTNREIARFHYPKGHARDIVLPIYRHALQQDRIRFYFYTEVTELLIENQRVTGITTRNLRDECQATYRADNIILATGGIAGNLQRIMANWPAHFPKDAQVLAGGSHFAQGLGHDMATRAGGVLDNMDKHWFYPVGIPDPLHPDSGLGITLTSPRGVWVDSKGERFINPLTSNKRILDVMMQQTPTGFWVIFDDEIRKQQRARTIRYRHDQPRYEREILFNPTIVKRAEDLTTLAKRAGLPELNLPATINRYNQLVANGEDSDFGRFPATHSDNVTMPPVAPTPLATPPFYAVRIYPSNAESMGGVRIDFSARVLSTAGEVIPGLYAAGELTGSMGMNGSKHRINGLYLGPAIMTGRLAAQSILKTPQKNEQPTLLPAISEIPTTATTLDVEDLKDLLAQSRPGYWHFEASHDVVLSRELACTTCHNERFPQETAQTNQQRLAQTTVCATCH